MTDEEIDAMIDPNALYTVKQAAKMLQKVDPSLTYEEAYREVCVAIDRGELQVAGYLDSFKRGLQ